VSLGTAAAVVVVAVFVAMLVWSWRQADEAERRDGIEL